MAPTEKTAQMQMQMQTQMRWGVWHDADDCWLASLSERNAELLSLVGTRREQVVVPRIVHQIWLGPHEIPARCREWMQTWTTLHPTWDYRLWTDADIKTLALRNQRAFDAARNYGEKSDILRYEILEQRGGVYADVDVACLQSFEPLMESFAFVAGMANTGCVEISNSVLVSVPHHPILRRLVDTIERDSQQPRLDASALALIAQMSGDATLFASASATPVSGAMDTIARTGPGLLTKTFMAAIGWTDRTRRVTDGFLPRGRERETVIALPTDYFSPLPNTSRDAAPACEVALPSVSLAVHYWARTWM